MNRIYLDNNATTALDPLVLEAMQPDLTSIPANPSSIHHFGKEARKRLAKAHHTLADYFNVKPHELIFTSGGTEAINMVLKGFFFLYPQEHIITTALEHSAVFEVIKLFEQRGAQVTYLKTGERGAATPEQVREAIQSDTKMIVLSAANSETGVKTDIEGIAKIAEERGIFYFVDGVALLGKESFTITGGVSAMAFSGHKLHAPKGSGLAFVRSPHKLVPLLHGGGQENNMRCGTENLASIVGIAKAIDLLSEKLPNATTHMKTLRDTFETELKKIAPTIRVNGTGPRLPNTSNISFPGVNGEELLINLDLQGIATSHGSACASGAHEPSRVLIDMGYPKKRVASAIRFSLSRHTTLQEIERTLAILREILT